MAELVPNSGSKLHRRSVSGAQSMWKLEDPDLLKLVETTKTHKKKKVLEQLQQEGGLPGDDINQQVDWFFGYAASLFRGLK